MAFSSGEIELFSIENEAYTAVVLGAVVFQRSTREINLPLSNGAEYTLCQTSLVPTHDQSSLKILSEEDRAFLAICG